MIEPPVELTRVDAQLFADVGDANGAVGSSEQRNRIAGASAFGQTEKENVGLPSC